MLDDIRDELSARSDYGDEIEDGARLDYSDTQTQTRLEIVRKLLFAFGMTSRRRKGGVEYEPASKEAQKRVLKVSAPRETRGCRRRSIGTYARRALFAVPFVILMGL